MLQHYDPSWEQPQPLPLLNPQCTHWPVAANEVQGRNRSGGRNLIRLPQLAHRDRSITALPHLGR